MLFKSLIFWLLVAVFFKQLLWVGIVPLWHFPDEPAHYAQIQNASYFGLEWQPFSSDEIYYSQIWLQVDRNELGRNAYTLHPEFNLPYTHTYWGEYEAELLDLPREYHHTQGLREATSYPMLYYQLLGRLDALFANASLIDRVFILRMISVILFTATVWIAFRVGEAIFTPKRSLAYILAGLVALQPMFSFVGASVNSDVLFNFWFTLFIYGGVRVLQTVQPQNSADLPSRTILPQLRLKLGSQLEGWLIVLLSIVGGLLTKQQMAIAGLSLPIFICFFWKELIFLSWSTPKRRIYSVLIGNGIIGVILLGTYWGELYRIWGYIQAGKSPTDVSLWSHMQWTVVHTYREILPWYWGVFKWLGVVLPRWVNRVQMAIVGITALGIGVIVSQWVLLKLWDRIKKTQRQSALAGIEKNLTWIQKFSKRQLDDTSTRHILFLIYISAFYFLMVTLWDWQFTRAFGFSFGVQGRYFFPTIVAHSALIIIGLRSFTGLFFSKAWVDRMVWGLAIWWFMLHAIGLWTVTVSYYDVSSWEAFVTQASQYKPVWFKSHWWLIWVELGIASWLGWLYMMLAVHKIWRKKI